jgi:predicted RNA-binding protein
VRAIVYPYSEAPVILEHVIHVEVDGEDVDLVDATDGRLAVDLTDVLRIELSEGKDDR